ncbi:MAG: LamG-like jellyroll fold domain-containing protein [Cyclobacteriaceae bacterium]
MAKYNTVTESWSGMGIQFNSIVNSIVSVGDDLYIGGWFTNAAGIASADRLVKYNTITNTWSSVGGGLDNQGIRSMVVVGSELYIGGQFYDAKGITGADHIVKYDLVTEQWSALDGGIDGIKINEIISFNDEYLFVSGRFDQAGEIPNTQNIASYHIPTETWSALGEGISNPVEDVEYHTSGLYATSLRGGKAEIILFDFENQTWTTIYTGPIARNRPSVIHSIGDDIYFTIDGLGVMHYNPSGTDITLLPGTNGAYMHEMQADSEGNLFFSRSNDFWRYPTRAKSCEQVVLTGIATVNNSLDCDDTSDLISPETVWYQDSDGDEYGDPSNTLTQCDQPQGYVLDNTDCDDNNPNVFPGQTWYADTDEDGFGDAGSTRVQCEQPTNYVINDQDCNDNDEFINPDAEDIENGIDDNCNGYVDDDNSFLTFSMPEQIFSSIDYENHTVTVLFPGNYSGLNQTMTYTISPGASISPEEGYSDVQIGEIVGFDITSPDQRVQQWNVELKEGLNNESDITSFEVYNQIGTSIIDPENHTISFEILHQPSLTFTPIIELSYMATVNPLSGEAVDFSSPITYSVTAEDGVTFQDWEVTANTVPILSLYYPFNGNADEELGNNQNGSFPNESPALTSGHLGDENSAYLFDRNNDVIELSSDILNGSLQGTLAAWVKFSNISGGGTPNNTIIGKGSDTDSQFGLFAGNNDFLFENYNNGNGAFLSIRYDFQSAGEDFSDGNWHHIAATFSETNAVLYVDGIPRAVDETTNGVYTNTSTNQITIGNWGSDRNDPFRGAIDEVRIYNYALSAYEIGAIACLTEDVDNDGDGTSSCADCDDTDPDVQNTTWYADTDGDGFGNPTVSLIQCDQPQGFVANDSDCNDDYIEVKPRSGYVDADGDGYGAIDSELIDYCGDGEGYSENDYDQDDSDKDIWLDDGSVCTIDSFSEEMGPIYAPLNCDDNNACTIDSCDPIEGCINTPVDCDDGDPSTIDLCNSISGCYYIPVSIATSVSTFSINDVEGVIDTENHEITIQADAGTFDLAAITADFTIRSGATAKIAGEIKESGDQLNPYTTPFIMTVIAEDGITSQDWTVTINIPPSVNAISPNAAVVGTRLLIDGSNFDPTSNTVTIDGINANVHSSSRTSLSVDVPEAAFGKDLEVSVTSRGQTTTLVGAFDVISTATDILTFSISEVAGVIDTENNEITVTADVGSFDLDALIAEFTVSSEATAQVNGEPKASGDQLNPYTTPFIMSVIAEDGLTSQDWTITINIPPSVDAISPNAAVLGTRLLIDGSNFDPTSNTVTIDGLNANVHSSSRTSLSVDVPEAAFGKDLDVSVTSRGQTTTLVGAFDVISIDTDILSFAINEMFAQVDALNHTIELNLPAGTNLSTLSPTLSLSEGATVIPESVVAQNFTNPVIYTVTAEDGSTTQDWTVTVTEQLASPTDITLNAAVLPENQEPGFVIGQLTTTDPSFDDTHIYDIVSVDGQTSSTLFIIESNILKSNTLFDFESGESYALLIKTTDQNGGDFEKTLVIDIENDADEDGFTISTGDCDDEDPNEYPNQIWYADSDGDGFGDANILLMQCVQPVNYVLNADDCDDTDAKVSPEMAWYADADGDGFGDANSILIQCEQPANYVLNSTDCDDSDADKYPNQIWYADVDGDGFGDPNTALSQCLQPSNYVLNNTDCDDTNANKNLIHIWFADSDGDGYGNPALSLTQCTPPANYVLNAADCDDTDANISPETIWYEDADGDGFGDENTFLTQCEQPEGYTLDFMLIPLGKVTTIEDEIKVYCSNNVLFINLPISNRVRRSFSVYNLSGKMLLETSSANSTSVNLDGMTPGVYLVKQAGSTLSYKIFIQ